MTNMNQLISTRLTKSTPSSKMAAMAKQAVGGDRTSFAGIFGLSEISEQEKRLLEQLLRNFATKHADILADLKQLITLTSEVKAINNQAAILHGERIKKVHALLTPYRDGAFTAWLIATYGNRQTPYNFMQYYDFYEALPKALRLRAEMMPKQAIYTLASRQGNFEKKVKIVEKYNGETKSEILRDIRAAFPLTVTDKRREDSGENVLNQLRRILTTLQKNPNMLSSSQKKTLKELTRTMLDLV